MENSPNILQSFISRTNKCRNDNTYSTSFFRRNYHINYNGFITISLQFRFPKVSECWNKCCLVLICYGFIWHKGKTSTWLELDATNICYFYIRNWSEYCQLFGRITNGEKILHIISPKEYILPKHYNFN